MAQRVILNRTDDSILDLLCNFKVRQTLWPAPRSLGGRGTLFVNGQHAQQCRLSSDRTSLISRWHHDFQLDLLSDWRNTICMKQSITPLLLSNQGRRCSVGILPAWTPNGLGQEAMTAVRLPSVACQLWLKVVRPE